MKKLKIEKVLEIERPLHLIDNNAIGFKFFLHFRIKIFSKYRIYFIR